MAGKKKQEKRYVFGHEKKTRKTYLTTRDVAVAVVGDGGTYVSNASGRVRILFAHAQPALFLL